MELKELDGVGMVHTAFDAKNVPGKNCSTQPTPIVHYLPVALISL
jgi:hypothetical protein